MKTHVRINNKPHELSLDLRLTLLDALRDVLGLTGTKKGVRELAITGMAAAIANAVYHATGSRIRSLPISIEKVLGHEFASRRTGSPLAAIAGTAGSTTQF